uniref:SAM domain-containing protein n=1 Tax=Grammatophora oceanica TaxID=210454 RepID=A0A7S1UWA4_9STRA
MRRKLRNMAVHLPIHWGEYADQQVRFPMASSSGVFKKYGCGEEGLRWDMMAPLSPRELVDLGLVPSGREPEVPFEPSLDSKTMPIGSFLEMCGSDYLDYETSFKRNGLKKVKALIELPQDERKEALEALGVTPLHRMVILSKLKGFR